MRHAAPPISISTTGVVTAASAVERTRLAAIGPGQRAELARHQVDVRADRQRRRAARRPASPAAGGRAAGRARRRRAAAAASFSAQIAVLSRQPSRTPNSASPMPSAISDSGTAACPTRSSVRSAMPGSGMPGPAPGRAARMLATTGLVTTFFAVSAKPASETCRVRAHSTDTVTSVHSTSELNTSTSETTGSAASPSVIFASGMPSSSVFAKMPPTAKTDCADAVHPEQPERDHPAQREHDQAAAEIRDQQPRVHRRQAREIAHQPEQQRRHRHREHELRQRVGDALRPAEPAHERVAQARQQEERRGERDDVPDPPASRFHAGRGGTAGVGASARASGRARRSGG